MAIKATAAGIPPEKVGTAVEMGRETHCAPHTL